MVFCFSAFSRIFEDTKLKAVFIALLALLRSLFVLYATEEWVFPGLNKIGITAVYRFTGLIVIFHSIAFVGFTRNYNPGFRFNVTKQGFPLSFPLLLVYSRLIAFFSPPIRNSGCI